MEVSHSGEFPTLRAFHFDAEYGDGLVPPVGYYNVATGLVRTDTAAGIQGLWEGGRDSANRLD